ncbi:hypothetical protein L1987_56176 [Smallanthus sonchifolius]|uniref:Uncharacterized protein n=1 Tax=Smallanthus sonchifolius TaxID=185202 RepID=A0ACB9ED32_9ASTR|nr:hypothetical protein L1987_56176 [Smallanthus sonchifolius]
MESNNQSSFWQFSDQLRVQSNNLSNLSLNDSIWSTSYASKRPEKDRRNFDIRVGGEFINSGAVNNSGSSNSDFNGFNFDWKIGSTNQNLEMEQRVSKESGSNLNLKSIKFEIFKIKIG